MGRGWFNLPHHTASLNSCTRLNHYQFALGIFAHEDHPLAFDATIAKNQGTFDPDNEQWTATGNTFSTLTSQNNDFWNELAQNDVDYYYWGLDLDQTPFQFDNILPIFADNERNCNPPKVNLTDQDYLSALSIMDAWEGDYQSLKYLRLALLDGGDSEALQEEVEEAWSNDTWEVRANLLSKSPFLTTETLYKVADRPDLLPHPVALEIFIANPNALRDNLFMEYLEIKSDPMPEYMIELLIQSRDASNFREILEFQLTLHQNGFLEGLRAALDAGLTKPNPLSETEYIALLERADHLSFDLELSQYYLSQGNFAAAQEVLDAIPSHTFMSPVHKSAKASFQLWIDLYASMEQNNSRWSTMTASESAMVFDLVNNYRYHFAGAQAAGAQSFWLAEDHYIPPYINEVVVPKSMGGGKGSKVEKNFEARLFPNPAKHLVQIHLPLSAKGDIERVEILSSQGKVLYTALWETDMLQATIDTRQIASGSYQVVLQKTDGSYEMLPLQIVQ